MSNVTPIRSNATPQLIEQLKRIADNTDNPSRSGGGGGPTLEARIAKLETTTDYVKRDIADIKTDIGGLRKEAREDFRILAGMLIFLGIGLTGVMAKGFNWL